MENLGDSLRGKDASPGAPAPRPEHAYAVLRLKHARPPGGAAPPPLSERLRTRDSAIARGGPAAVGGGASWGVGASFRFALPDEALPGHAAGRPRLPTRGPPQVAHVCVYQRSTGAFAALGLAAQETYLGDVEVPLARLTDDAPLTEWLPLRAAEGTSHWFLRVQVSLRFLLVALADAPDAPPRSATPDRAGRPSLRSTFSDLGD